MDQLIKKINDAKKEVEKAENELFEGLYPFFLENNVDLVFIQGYTPGFNDGEPCTHSQHTLFDLNEYEDYGAESYVQNFLETYNKEVVENNFFDNCEKEKEIVKCKKLTLKNINDNIKEEDKIREVFNKHLYNMIEKKYDTDFHLYIYACPINKKIVIKKEHYDCGY